MYFTYFYRGTIFFYYAILTNENLKIASYEKRIEVLPFSDRIMKTTKILIYT